ncbi:response regulator [Neorhodopirellula pilleata]|uniref:Chemotaxis protein CheY n=1 Tax=Neorhodopirellula pilleata TaxID=2714738 RepID=A0A5C5ZN92_9BACT|nr:response regulator [Neorhodopirellula pilleata]TWT87913.1 Chemotaxis protein CheY [Neorhodopirellula pilleata]
MLRRSETNDPPVHAATVLVVDDTASARYLVTTTLGRLGFSTVIAGNGQTALETLRDSQLDAIVTDLEMPEMGGEELIRAVRNHRDRRIRNLPIIVCTSKVDASTLATLARLGVNAVVPKPVDVRLLVEHAIKLFKIA